MKRRNCTAALSEGIVRETCHNFRGMRQWVMCRAWQREGEGVPFADAISQSWDEAIEKCRALGGSPGPEEKPKMVKAVHVIDRETGIKRGSIVLADNEVTVCFNDDCTTTKGDEGVFYIAQALYDRLGYELKRLWE